jgi:hypothetical protein
MLEYLIGEHTLYTGRQQNVVIKNNSSAYCDISAGVPQVSVLALS